MAPKAGRTGMRKVTAFFGNSGFAIRTFREISKYAKPERLFSLIQKLEERGYAREDGLYFINVQGANTVEKALKLGDLNLETAVEAIGKVGAKKVDRVVELARRKKKDPAQVLKRYLAVAERFSKSVAFRRNLLIRQWMEFKGFPEKQIRDFFRVGTPFMESFKPKEVRNHKLELDISFMQALDLAPITMSLTKGTPESTVGFMSLFFSEEAGHKIVSIHDIQTDPFNRGKGTHPAILEDWPVIVGNAIKDHAKRLGFSKIRIIRPERHPHIMNVKNSGRIKSFYYTIAGKLGIRRKTASYLEAAL